MEEAYRPATLKEALDIRSAQEAVPFAGGTDLMVKLRRGAGALPNIGKPVLFLDRCAELSRITTGESGVEVGSMVTLAGVSESPLAHPALHEIIGEIGAPGLRNVATIGGNICNASPAADTLPFLYAFDARVRLLSSASERILRLEDFITGPGATVLHRDEILFSIIIPSWNPRLAYHRKVGTRRANALSKVSIAAFADLHADRVSRVRMALGAVAPTVVRLRRIEEMLEGGSPDGLHGLSGDIRGLTMEAIRPIDDQRSTAEYRGTVAANLVAFFVERVLGLPRATRETPPLG